MRPPFVSSVPGVCFLVLRLTAKYWTQAQQIELGYKATFNYCVRYGGGRILNGKAGNNIKSIKEFVAKLKEISGFKMGYAVLGMEVTGVYGLVLMIL